MEKIKKLTDMISASFFEKLFISWFFSGTAAIFTGGEDILLTAGNITSFIIVFISFFVIASCIEHMRKGSAKGILVVSVLIFALAFLVKSDSIFSFIPVAIFYCLAVYHFWSGRKKEPWKMPKKLTVALTVIIPLVFFGIATAQSLLRYKTYSAPNFDFGIFSHMYYNMRTTFQPVSTCERDMLLSHFAVHFSPALYVFLPIYFVFPFPETVAVCQTLAIYSAVIPFILIGKKLNLSAKSLVLCAAIFAASSALAGSSSYDFHENCLLVPFLMWMFYFYETKKTPLLFLFAILTLMVKEDAFVYVAVFAVYIFISNKDYIKGIVLAVVAVVWFVAACSYLEQFGTGIMSYRYDAMVGENESLFGIIKTLITNPAYSIQQIFSTTDKSYTKVLYFLQMFCPVAFLPLITKKPSRMILVLPILLNLLTDYSYQYNVYFQYGFGIGSFLLYATILNISDIEEEKRDFTALIAAGLAVMMYFTLFIPKVNDLAEKYIDKAEMYEEMDEVLAQIPEDKTITASTRLVPHLTNRKEIYASNYHKTADTDYLVIDARFGITDEIQGEIDIFTAAGYEKINSGSDYILIYQPGS